MKNLSVSIITFKKLYFMKDFVTKFMKYRNFMYWFKFI